MSVLQTAGFEYNGEETVGLVVRPQFTGFLPPGMKPILTEGAGSVKLTFFGSTGNALAAYASGFQGGVASAKKQKKFELGEFKAERAWSKQDYSSIVQRQMQDVKTAFQNGIFKSEFATKIPFGLLGLDPTVPPTDEQLLSMAEFLVFTMGVAQGIMEVFYLADSNAIVEKAEGSGVFPNQVVSSAYDDDIRFNPVDGLWKNIYDIVATSPTVNQVKLVEIASAAIAQINTITITGTGGTATVTVKGIAQIATWDGSDLTGTAADFVTSWADNYLAVGLVLTSSTADLIFTANVPGVGFDDGTITNIGGGNLAGSSAATRGNTVADALAADEAMATFRKMVKGQGTSLKAIPRERKVILATQSMIVNFEESLGASGSDDGTSVAKRQVMIDGATNLKFNGIPIFEMPIDAAIAAYDFGRPHRAILGPPENIGPVLSTAGDFAESMLWFNKDQNENRARIQLEMGGDFWLPELMVVTY